MTTKTWRAPTPNEDEKLKAYIKLKKKKDTCFRKWLTAIFAFCAAFFFLMALYAENAGTKFLVGGIGAVLVILCFVDIPHNKKERAMQKCYQRTQLLKYNTSTRFT